MICDVFDDRFKPYGRVIREFDGRELCRVLRSQTPLPEETCYVPEAACLMALAERGLLEQNVFGGLPIQMGWCNGHNTRLNCLEYHRSSELNIGADSFVLLLGKREDIRDGIYDTANVRAFRVPAGVLVELYATTLHYAPVQTGADGFRVCVVLPKGTNLEKPDIVNTFAEDPYLFAANKWLLAHRDAGETRQGACTGLVGENIDISSWGQLKWGDKA